MKTNFNDFRFEGLNYRDLSNKYWTMNRVHSSNNKVVVRAGENHLLQTKFGWALILDQYHVVFLKSWQVSQNYFGTEVLLNREFWNVKKWGNFETNFLGVNEELHNFDYWLETAKMQENLVDSEGTKINRVRWSKAD
ncbi:MAG: hypothetical protein QXI77_00985 [Nanopusillaceae archaeon]